MSLWSYEGNYSSENANMLDLLLYLLQFLNYLLPKKREQMAMYKGTPFFDESTLLLQPPCQPLLNRGHSHCQAQTQSLLGTPGSSINYNIKDVETFSRSSFTHVTSAAGKKINDLSKNLLIIVCEYLAFFEIVSLICSNKKLLIKLDDSLDTIENLNQLRDSCEQVSYMKRRGTLFFQNFFFQQFPGSSDIFIQRMATLTAPAQSSSQVSSTRNSQYALANAAKGNTAKDAEITSTYTMATFLPFVKQSSIIEEVSSKQQRFSMAPPVISGLPKLTKEGSANPFGQCFDSSQHSKICGGQSLFEQPPRISSTVTTAFTDAKVDDQSNDTHVYSDLQRASFGGSQMSPFISRAELGGKHYQPMKKGHSVCKNRQPINYYINETFKKWKSMYVEAISNKKDFVGVHQSDFYTAFFQQPNDFAKEFFMDPSLCENPCFALPQLTRENFNQKGMFYRTEKVLVCNFPLFFQRQSVDYTKQLLWAMCQEMQTSLAKNLHSRSVLSDLLTEDYTSSTPSFSENNLTKRQKLFEAPSAAPESFEQSPLFSLPPLKPSSLFAKVNNEAPLYATPKLNGLQKEIPKLADQNRLANDMLMQDLMENEEMPEFLPNLMLSKQASKMTPTFNVNEKLFQPKQLAEVENFDIDEDNLPSIPEPFAMPSMKREESKSFGLNLSPPTLQKTSTIPSGFSLPVNLLQPGFKKNSEIDKQFEVIGLDQNNRIVGTSDEISILYKNISSYTLKQFKLLCTAHKNQLDFILEQIKMAPTAKKNYFMFLEDYVEKERNLRFLLRKISQNFIVQESFTETMLRNNIYQAKEVKKQPYLCDFLLLEYLDSIWMNEIYRAQRKNLVSIVCDVISSIHELGTFEQLAEKKEIIRKVVNIIHQTEFNFKSNKDFLSISQLQKEALPPLKSIGKTASLPEDEDIYEELAKHMKICVKHLLKQMQRKAQSVQEFMEMCQTYEQFEFQKLEEVEYFYLETRKYYLCKTFSYELSVKLENNKFAKSSYQNLSLANESSSIGSLSATTSATSQSQADGSDKMSNSSMSSRYQNLTLNTAIHFDLVNTFFHQLLRRLIGQDDFKKFMQSDQLIQSLFVLFHIEPNSNTKFASEFNRLLTEAHSQIEELLKDRPELLTQASASVGQTGDVRQGGGQPDENEEVKEQQPMAAGAANPYKQSTTVGSDTTSVDLARQCPYSLLGSDEELQGEDDEQLMMLEEALQAPPEMNRCYSEQKRYYFKGLSWIIFSQLRQLEAEFDFKQLILEQKEIEKRRVMEEIQQRIENFNQQLNAFKHIQPAAAMEISQQLPNLQHINSNQQQQARDGNNISIPQIQTTQSAPMSSSLPPLLEGGDLDDEELPDVGQLQSNFASAGGLSTGGADSFMRNLRQENAFTPQNQLPLLTLGRSNTQPFGFGGLQGMSFHLASGSIVKPPSENQDIDDNDQQIQHGNTYSHSQNQRIDLDQNHKLNGGGDSERI